MAQAQDILYLEVIVNGRNTNRIAEFTRRGNDWEMSYKDFLALGLTLNLPTKDRVMISDIPGTEAIYDSEFQRLIITVPSSMLPLQYLQANVPVHSDNKTQRDSGLFINYNLASVSGDMSPAVSSLWHEVNFFSNNFSIISNGIFQHGTDYKSSSGYTRFETFYERENESNLSELTIGDVINATPNWGRSIRMGGIRIARDYELDPTLITYPLPEFYGESALPGSVELIINNQLRWSDQVKPGPFLINTVPYMSGAGVAQVVTTNAQGQQVREAVNFYVTSELLKQGMFDYDVTLGFRRKDFGLVSNSYADTPVISGSFRYGLNRYITPQGLIQTGEGLRMGGAGVTFLAGPVGVIEIAGTHSNYYGEDGNQASVGYNYTYKTFGVNARYLRRYGNYRDLGALDQTAANTINTGSVNSGILNAEPLNTNSLRGTQSQIGFSFHNKYLGGFNAGYFRIVDDQHNVRDALNISWNQYFAHNITAFLNFNRQLYGQRNNAVSFSVSIPFGTSGQTSIGVQRDNKGELHTQLQAMTNPPYSGGFGWSAGIDDSEEKNRYLTADWRAKYAELSANAYTNNGQTQYTESINGALVFMDNHLYATHFISDAFAIVDAGSSKVPVLIGNQLVGNTDKNGKLLVPDLGGYLENRISIDPLLLPANASIDSIEQTIIPRRKGGVDVKFNIRFLQAALVEVITSDRKALPAGAVLTTRNGEKNYIVGWGGEVYLENLSEPLSLYWDEGECFVELKPAEDKAVPLPRLGPFICESATENN